MLILLVCQADVFKHFSAGEWWRRVSFTFQTTMCLHFRRVFVAVSNDDWISSCLITFVAKFFFIFFTSQPLSALTQSSKITASDFCLDKLSKVVHRVAFFITANSYLCWTTVSQRVPIKKRPPSFEVHYEKGGHRVTLSLSPPVKCTTTAVSPPQPPSPYLV